MSFQYFLEIEKLLKTILNEEKENINSLIDLTLKTINEGKSIYVFGATHAGIVSQELYYRAGGLVLMNPVFPREIMPDNKPVSLTSGMERLNGYGEVIVNSTKITEGDLIILHSVSGRNPVTIDFAIASKKRNANVVVITNLEYSKSVSSRHASGLNLFEYADLVIDNHGAIGDACITIPGTNQTVAPTSTISSCVIMNTVVSEVALRMAEMDVEILPIFYSANMDGTDDLNKKVYEKYQSQIHYEL